MIITSSRKDCSREVGTFFPGRTTGSFTDFNSKFLSSAFLGCGKKSNVYKKFNFFCGETLPVASKGRRNLFDVILILFLGLKYYLFVVC